MHNPTLADKQGLDELTREIIDALHVSREALNIVGETARTDETNDRMKIIYDFWYKNEKLLQKLWKFPEDDKYIKFWEFGGCTCPKMDNDDRYPTEHYITVENCKVHGWEK